MNRPIISQPVALNCLGGSYRMTCHCNVNYTKLPCPVHYPELYLKEIARRKKLAYPEGGW